MDAQIDTFSTGNIDTPTAFHRLRRDLHDAAGADRIATSTTRDTIDQLRTRARCYLERMQTFYAAGCYPLGDWYAELAQRLEQTATEIENKAGNLGVLS